MFSQTYARVFEGDRQWQSLQVPARAPPTPGIRHSTYIKHPPYFEGMARAAGPVDDIKGARVLALLGDSITTDHISPAGSIKKDSPAGQVPHQPGRRSQGLQLVRRPPGQPRGDGARHVRQRPPARTCWPPAPRAASPATCPTAQVMSIYDAAMKYAADGVPLVVLAGKEYGSGSSRDWAAKGTRLLGVRAVIAESYERIHRSNLVGMGVVPLEFLPGESVGQPGPDRRGGVRDRGPAGAAGRRPARRPRADHRPLRAARRQHGRVPGQGAHRHPAGGHLLPARRHPAVRAAADAGRRLAA